MKLDEYLNPDISDEQLFKLDNFLSKKLFNLVAEVVKEERQLYPPKTEGEIIIEITNKWINNKFIHLYRI